MRAIACLTVLCAVILFGGCLLLPIVPTSSEYLITDAIPYTPIGYGSTFFSKTITVDFRGTSAILSLDDDGTGSIMVDDVAFIDIRHSDGSIRHQVIDFTDGCAHAVNMLPPQQIASWLEWGSNEITFTFKDQCGGNGGCTRIYLVLE